MKSKLTCLMVLASLTTSCTNTNCATKTDQPEVITKQINNKWLIKEIGTEIPGGFWTMKHISSGKCFIVFTRYQGGTAILETDPTICE